MRRQRRIGPLALAATLAAACASTPAAAPTRRPQGPHAVREGEGFHIIGQQSPGGAGDAYDATLLFDRAVAAMREGRCDEASLALTRITAEFAGTRWERPAWYNRGICAQRGRHWPDAAQAFREASRAADDPSLTRDAWFRLAVVGESASQTEWVIEAADALLGRRELTLTDRVEALARRAAAQLARNDLDLAERDANEAISLCTTAQIATALDDDTHAAEARVVGAEVTRLRAAAVTFTADAPDSEARITQRANLVIHAHAQYNDAIRAGNPHWAAAAGFRIGEIYRDFYNAILDAPMPQDWEPATREAYRRRVRERLRVLLQGAIRAWEATMAMARRTGITDNSWTRRAEEALNELRSRVLDEESTRH
ncbi:MAG: hypothetical protein JNK72_09745 [Myxococcales bacterium]|nr:hypothetical protein [Myxococcales bacterium]